MTRIVLALGTVCAALWADCPEGSYKTTDADKKFLIEITAAAKAALPPVPEGWRLNDKNPPTYVPPSDLCKGSEKEPLITGYYVEYVWEAGQKELALKRADINKRMGAVQHTCRSRAAKAHDRAGQQGPRLALPGSQNCCHR